jgi:hypothetical protein
MNFGQNLTISHQFQSFLAFTSFTYYLRTFTYYLRTIYVFFRMRFEDICRLFRVKQAPAAPKKPAFVQVEANEDVHSSV